MSSFKYGDFPIRSCAMWSQVEPRMEKSKTQEAMAEYKAMARDLAEEFQDKVANPTAEAFIE